MIYNRYWILPDQVLIRNIWAKVTRFGAHITVSKFEPCPSEGICELIGILIEMSCDLLIDWVRL